MTLKALCLDLQKDPRAITADEFYAVLANGDYREVLTPD